MSGGISEFWDEWGSQILGSASAAASAAINIDGLGDAAEKQLQGVIAGLDLQKGNFDEIRQALDPFITAGQDVTGAAVDQALGGFEFDDIDLNEAQPQTSDFGTLPDVGVPNVGLGGVSGTGIDLSGLSDVGALNVTAGGAAGGSVDVNQTNPFDPNDPVLRFLQEESRRSVESSAAARGNAISGGTLQELSDRAQNVAMSHASNVQNVMSQRDNIALGAQGQEFDQGLAATQYNFVSGLNLQDQQLENRANEFAEIIATGQLTFDQEVAFRQQLNAEEQQVFDALSSNRQQLVAEAQATFAQNQQVFQNSFNINAQEFMNALNIDANQFNKIAKVMTIGANSAAGFGTNATDMGIAGADLLAATGLAQAGLDLGQSQQMATALTNITDILMGGAS